MKYIYKTKRLKNVKFVKDCSEGYKVCPKIKNIEVSFITLYDYGIISYYIEKHFLFKFKKILEAMKIDDDDNGEVIVLSIDELEAKILFDYKNYLSVDQMKEMLKDIYFLKHKLLNKNITSSKSR